MIRWEDDFNELSARVLFGRNELTLSWALGEPMPAGLVDDIMKALDTSASPSVKRADAERPTEATRQDLHTSHSGVLRTLNRVLAEEEQEDKDKYDAAYSKYVADASEGSEARLLELLAALVKKTEGVTASQPDELDTAEALIEASKAHNDDVHAQLRSLVQAFGGVYHAGPVKKQSRVQEKANSDYMGVITKVVDTIRGSGIMHR